LISGAGAAYNVEMRVIPVASGKGGVGKSLVAANLAVAFAQAGKRVILADLDLGASNLHLIIGHRKPGNSLGAFLSGGGAGFESLIAATDIKNLCFIPGDAEIPGAANLKPGDRRNIIRNLLSLDVKTGAEIVILDLGAGTHQSVLDFFLCSGNGIVISAPTVTSTLSAYVFLKNAVFRLMYKSFARNSDACRYLEKMRKSGPGFKMLYLPKMLEEIRKADGKSWGKFKAAMDRFRPSLIINMIDEPKEAAVAMKIRRSCEAYLGLKVEHLGVIYRDSLQDISLASRLPIMLYKPQSVISQAICRIAVKIGQAGGGDTFDFNRDLDESYRAAEREAEADFEGRRERLEEMLHSGVLSEGALAETVKSQQFEISRLKKENGFLKGRLSGAVQSGLNAQAAPPAPPAPD